MKSNYWRIFVSRFENAKLHFQFKVQNVRLSQNFSGINDSESLIGHDFNRVNKSVEVVRTNQACCDNNIPISTLNWFLLKFYWAQLKRTSKQWIETLWSPFFRSHHLMNLCTWHAKYTCIPDDVVVFFYSHLSSVHCRRFCVHEKWKKKNGQI